MRDHHTSRLLELKKMGDWIERELLQMDIGVIS